jgi:hypothetical protein
MEDTTVKPINTTEIELRGILDKIGSQLDSDPNSTVVLPASYSSETATSTSYNNPPVTNLGYNRKVYRYAKKHRITTEQAFKRLYK